MVKSANEIFREFQTTGIPSSGVNKPRKADIREWGTYLENLASSGGSARVFETRANLYANLNADANTMAWVVRDSTAAYNGIYKKTGATGTGSWSKIAELPVGILYPVYSGGTANAIEYESYYSLTEGQLVVLYFVETTTSSTVTIKVNGGTAYPLKTVSGNNPPSGAIIAASTHISYFDGTYFRLLTDLSGAAIQSAAEAAAVAAGTSATAAASSASAAAASAIQAAGAVTGVASFKGRTGSVTPQAGDYTAPLLSFGSWTTVASASTVDLGAQTSRNIIISGTETIGSFGSSGPADNIPYWVMFSGGSTLVNSENLVIQGGINILTAPGDYAVVMHNGTSTWHVTYFSANMVPNIWQGDWNAGLLTRQAPISPQQLKWAVAALSPNTAFTDLDIISYTGTYYVPANLDTSVTPMVFVFGAGGGAAGGGGGVAISQISLIPSESIWVTVGGSVLSGVAGSSQFKTLSASGGTGGSNGASGWGWGGSIANSSVWGTSWSGLVGPGTYLARAMFSLPPAKQSALFGASYPGVNSMFSIPAVMPYDPLNSSYANVLPGARGAGTDTYGAAGAVFVFFRRK